MLFSRSKPEMVSADKALPGRATPIATADRHFVTGEPLNGPFPESAQVIVLGLGCFWGAERRFWQTEGVISTAAGYAGGFTPNPTYEEVCSGGTGHTEVVRVVFDPAIISLEGVLKVFWEAHDPTQGMQQGNDIGTQYRSAIYTIFPAQDAVIQASFGAYQRALDAAGKGKITTQTGALQAFYMAEEYHQQYLAKNPAGYCGLGGTGVACPAGLDV